MKIRIKKDLRLFNEEGTISIDIFEGEEYECNDYVYCGVNIGCTKIIEREGCEFYIHENFFEVIDEENEDIESDKDNINPQHYKNGTRGIETIDTIIELLSEEGFFNYCVGNIIKYVSRYEYKNGLEDLRKAKWYSEIIIKKLFEDVEELKSYIYEKEEHVMNVLNKEQLKGYLKGSIISKCNMDIIEEVKINEILCYLNLLIEEIENE